MGKAQQSGNDSRSNMTRIVVGLDGSKSASGAVEWAAREARRRGSDVLVVQSWTDPLFLGPSLGNVWTDPNVAERAARSEFESDVDALVSAHPGVHFDTELVSVSPSVALVEASQTASMVVVGSRGRGGFSSLLLGSVSQRVAATAASSVVVVRGDDSDDGKVVVGVDGSPSSRVALHWAAEAARVRDCPLRVVMAWTYLLPQGEHGSEPFQATYTEADAWRVLGAIVDDELGTDPKVEVDLQAVCDLPARALIEHAEGAALLVVGPHGLTRHPRLDLGSAALQVLHHAPCPVAVARPGADAGAAADR